MSPESSVQPVPRLYLLDVEGTVAPISLVYEQLFPFARAHLAAFLEERITDPAVAADLNLLLAENRAATANRRRSKACKARYGKRVSSPAN
jgi:methionine salvage enolase-phosphatase E1